MNDELDELKDLENELTSLTPRQLSLPTRQNIYGALTTQSPARRLIFAPAFAVAALVLICLGIMWFRPVQDGKNGMAGGFVIPAEDVFKPISLNTVLMNSVEAGVILSNNIPLQRMRYQFVDHAEWENQKTKTKFSATIPRDEIKFVTMDAY